MTKENEKGRIGSSFDDFLKDQGTFEITTEQAIKRVLAYQLEMAMKEKGSNLIRECLERSAKSGTPVLLDTAFQKIEKYHQLLMKPRRLEKKYANDNFLYEPSIKSGSGGLQPTV